MGHRILGAATARSIAKRDEMRSCQRFSFPKSWATRSDTSSVQELATGSLTKAASSGLALKWKSKVLIRLSLLPPVQS